MLETDLLKSIVENYDEVKTLMENNTMEQLKDYINADKLSALDREGLEILETFKEYCEEDYPQFQSIISKLRDISQKTEYNKVDYLLQCKNIINFNGFNIGTSYYGGRNGYSSVKIIINDKEANELEVFKIMKYFGLDYKEYGNFLKYLITIANYYWNGDFCMNLDYYNSYLPDGYEFQKSFIFDI